MNKLLVIIIAPVPSLSALISEMIGEGQGTSGSADISDTIKGRRDIEKQVLSCVLRGNAKRCRVSSV